MLNEDKTDTWMRVSYKAYGTNFLLVLLHICLGFMRNPDRNWCFICLQNAYIYIGGDSREVPLYTIAG